MVVKLCFSKCRAALITASDSSLPTGKSFSSLLYNSKPLIQNLHTFSPDEIQLSIRIGEQSVHVIYIEVAYGSGHQYLLTRILGIVHSSQEMKHNHLLLASSKHYFLVVNLLKKILGIVYSSQEMKHNHLLLANSQHYFLVINLLTRQL